MKDFKLIECIAKVEVLPTKDDKINILWQWMKQGNINLKQFKALLPYCI